MRSIWVTALVACAVLLSGCADSGTHALRSGSSTGAASQHAPEPFVYASLGDSFSSGPLIPAVRADPGSCLRSTNNYPAFLAGWLEATTYVDRTCAGATSTDLTRAQMTRIGDPQRVPPQVRGVPRNADLVTVGIGGNDLGVFESMVRCFGDDPSRAGLCDPQTQARVLLDAGRVEHSVARALRAVTRRAPHAQVVLVGYPRTMPPRGTCRVAGVPASHADWVRQVERRLDASLRGAASEVGVEYVDLAGPSRGHDVCAGRAAWVNGWPLLTDRAAPFHPFQRGMRGVAAAVFEQVRGEPAPTGASAEPRAAAIVLNEPGR